MKAKSLQNTATYQKLWGGVPSTILLYHGGRSDFACTSEGINWRLPFDVNVMLNLFLKEILNVNLTFAVNVTLNLSLTLSIPGSIGVVRSSYTHMQYRKYVGVQFLVDVEGHRNLN